MSFKNTSKFFKAEIEAYAEAENRSSNTEGTANFTETTNGKKIIKEKAQFEVPDYVDDMERKVLKKRVSKYMANKMVASFRDSMSSTRGTTLEALSLKLAGTKNVGRKTKKTKAKYDTGTTEETSGLIETVGGKRRRASTLRGLLQEIMQRYVVADMTRPNAPLKFQSGRFAGSTQVTGVAVQGNNISLYFSYMVRPYSVFDPSVSSYMNLSSEGRNPRRIIGSALDKAARDVIHARYNINTRQGV